MADNAYVNVGGYYENGDGGGGTFQYRALSRAKDDGGVTIAPNSGAGRWVRQFFSRVNIRYFGAKGDGSSNDHRAIQNAIDYAQAAGATVYIPGGGHFINRLGPSDRALTALGCLKLEGDGYASWIDGTGNYWQGQKWADLGFGLVVDNAMQGYNGQSGSPYAGSGALHAGTTQVALARTTGLSAGSPLYLELGAAASDASQPYYRMFATIKAVGDHVITLDNAVPEDVNGTRHTLWLITAPARNVSVRNLRLTNFPLSVSHVENGVFSDLYWDETNWPFNVGRSYNLTIERVTVDHCAAIVNGGSGLAPIFGRFLYCVGVYNLAVRDIRIQSLAAEGFITTEAESRDVWIEDVHLGLTDEPANTNQVPVFQNTGQAAVRPIIVRNLYLNALTSSRAFLIGSEDENGTYNFIFDGLFLLGNGTAGAAYASPPNIVVPLNCVTGFLYYKNANYFLRQAFRRVLPIAAGSGSQVFDLGVKGLLTHLRVYASSLAGLTAVYANFNDAAAGPDELHNLAAGRFSQDLSAATATGVGSANYYSEVRKLGVRANGSQAADQFLAIEGEVLVSPTAPEGSPDDLVGAGPPSANAVYFGQHYWDVTNNKHYQAKAVGKGPGDWAPF